MKYIHTKILLSAALSLMINCCFAQSDSTTKANEIIKLEQRLCDASPGDAVTWGKYLDPKWHIIAEDGSNMFKDEYLKSLVPFQKGYSGNIKVTKPILNFYKDIAVITYVADEHETVYGQNLHTTYATMDTWYKTDTSWMMICMLNFEVPALPPPVKVSAGILKLYVGTYELTEGKLATITLRQDTLYIQKTNGKPVALFPETNNVFFRLSDTRGRKIFTKGDDGKMILVERRNGQDLVWKLIK